MGGKGLPACLGGLASGGAWGPLPGALPELRVGSVTRAEPALAGISEQVAVSYTHLTLPTSLRV